MIVAIVNGATGRNEGAGIAYVNNARKTKQYIFNNLDIILLMNIFKMQFFCYGTYILIDSLVFSRNQIEITGK